MQQLMTKVRANNEENDNVDSDGVDHHKSEVGVPSKDMKRVVVRVQCQ